MLPRVALEYGQTRWAARTSSVAVPQSLTDGNDKSRVTANL